MMQRVVMMVRASLMGLGSLDIVALGFLVGLLLLWLLLLFIFGVLCYFLLHLHDLLIAPIITVGMKMCIFSDFMMWESVSTHSHFALETYQSHHLEDSWEQKIRLWYWVSVRDEHLYNIANPVNVVLSTSSKCHAPASRFPSVAFLGLWLDSLYLNRVLIPSHFFMILKKWCT